MNETDTCRRYIVPPLQAAGWENDPGSELHFTLPDVLKVAPLLRHGNVAQIVTKFGGSDERRNAVNQLQSMPCPKKLTAGNWNKSLRTL